MITSVKFKGKKGICKKISYDDKPYYEYLSISILYFYYYTFSETFSNWTFLIMEHFFLILLDYLCMLKNIINFMLYYTS